MYDEIEFEIQDETSLEFDLEKEAYLVEPKTEKLEVIPSQEQQEFKPVQGTYYNDVVVEKIPDGYVIPKLDKKTITENGTYKASDDELDGYNEVEVHIQSSDLLNETSAGYYIENYHPATGLLSILKEIPAIKWTGAYSYQSSYYYSLAYFFLGALNLKQIDLSNFENTDKVDNTTYMFYNCRNLEEIKGVENINFSNVSYLSYMFSACIKLKRIDHLLKKIKKATNFNSIFSYCSSLEEVNIDNDFFNNTLTSFNFNYTFFKCSKIKKINIPANIKIENMRYAFSECFELETINIENFDYEKISGNTASRSFDSTFYLCRKLANLTFGSNYGSGFPTSLIANNYYAKLDLHYSEDLTEQSLINVLNSLYDIATKGCKVQQVIIGPTNMAKLTSDEGQQALTNAQNKGWAVS